MQLIIYRFCDEDQANPQIEKVIRTQWAETLPTEGQLVGMGSDRTFEVAHVYSFQPSEGGEVEGVHIAFCQLPGSAIPQAEWGCWKWKHRHPNETFNVRLEAVGLPDMGCGMNFIGEPPNVGQRIYGAVPIGEGTKMRPMPTQWVIDSYSTYEPIGESPYKAVYLTWCKVVKLETAIAA